VTNIKVETRKPLKNREYSENPKERKKINLTGKTLLAI